MMQAVPEGMHMAQASLAQPMQMMQLGPECMHLAQASQAQPMQMLQPGPECMNSQQALQGQSVQMLQPVQHMPPTPPMPASQDNLMAIAMPQATQFQFDKQQLALQLMAAANCQTYED